MEFQRTPAAETLEWIVCSGTVYVNDPAAELPIEQGIRSDLPQLTRVGLDPSFLTDLHTILMGRTALDIAEDFPTDHVAKGAGMRRVAHSIPIPKEYSVQLFMCCDDLCNSLATVGEERVADIVQRWRALLWPSLQHGAEPEGRRQFRAEVLPRVVALAREAVSSGRKLMIRIEFRRHTKDVATGAVHSREETRH